MCISLHHSTTVVVVKLYHNYCGGFRLVWIPTSLPFSLHPLHSANFNCSLCYQSPFLLFTWIPQYHVAAPSSCKPCCSHTKSEQTTFPQCWHPRSSRQSSTIGRIVATIIVICRYQCHTCGQYVGTVGTVFRSTASDLSLSLVLILLHPSSAMFAPHALPIQSCKNGDVTFRARRQQYGYNQDGSKRCKKDHEG